MKASILDLRREMGKIIAALDVNEEVTLTYRGKAKGKIVPISGGGKDVRSHAAFGMWADRKDMADVKGYVRNIRKGRWHAV